MAAFDTRASKDEGRTNERVNEEENEGRGRERDSGVQMGIAHTIRIRDRYGRRLSLLLTCENCANKCVFPTYVHHKRPAPTVDPAIHGIAIRYIIHIFSAYPEYIGHTNLAERTMLNRLI